MATHKNAVVIANMAPPPRKKKQRDSRVHQSHVTQAFSARQAMKNKDNGLNTPIPSRNALENLSLNRNGKVDRL